MTQAERTRLLLLAASAGTEATLRRALFDWAMEGVEADTPANPEKLAVGAGAGAGGLPDRVEGADRPVARKNPAYWARVGFPLTGAALQDIWR